MNLRALCLLAGTMTLAGCGSQSAKNTNPTAPPSTGGPATSTSATDPTVAPTEVGTAVAIGDAYAAGMSDLRRRDFQGSITQFTRAISSRHHLAQAYAGRGTAEFSLAQYAPGFADYRRAAARSPKNASYLYGAAYGALYSSKYKAAVLYATRAIQVQPKNSAAYHLRMLAYGRLVMPKMQLADAKHVARLEPKNAQAYNDLGIANANNRHYQKALVAFGKAIRLQPKNYSFYSNEGVVQNQLKKTRAAIADFKKAEKLAPASAKRSLALTISALKKQSH